MRISQTRFGREQVWILDQSSYKRSLRSLRIPQILLDHFCCLTFISTIFTNQVGKLSSKMQFTMLVWLGGLLSLALGEPQGERKKNSSSYPSRWKNQHSQRLLYLVQKSTTRAEHSVPFLFAPLFGRGSRLTYHRLRQWVWRLLIPRFENCRYWDQSAHPLHWCEEWHCSRYQSLTNLCSLRELFIELPLPFRHRTVLHGNLKPQC